MKYAKILDGELVMTTIPSNTPQGNKEITIAKILEEGFLLYEEDELITAELQPYEKLVAKYRQEEDKIVAYFEVEANDPELIQKEIDNLTAQLTATDYKVIKNHEYLAAGEAAYYDPIELFNEREPLRQQIRELEQLRDDNL